MCSDMANALAIGFSVPNGDVLELRNRAELSANVLPKYFKHNTVQSLVRQLNNYGFIARRKSQLPPSTITDSPKAPDRADVTQSFIHPNFIQGRRDLLCHIQRKAAIAKQEEAEEQYNMLYSAHLVLAQRNRQLRARIQFLEDALAAPSFTSSQEYLL
ncbi:hypothetical protein BASA81_000670 [Batrachochytrium salamandrivorans]|nr:hypothetical protein BASA81_000670 [Batrachochytrium salamandrivorans]